MNNETAQAINSAVNIGGLIVTLIIIPLVTFFGKYVISWIDSKKALLQLQTDSTIIKSYIDDICNFAKRAILATNQTYVDSLKASGTFTVESQKIAFDKSKDAIIALLNKDKIELLKKEVGDFDKFIENVIESEVKKSKNETNILSTPLIPIYESTTATVDKTEVKPDVTVTATK